MRRHGTLSSERIDTIHEHGLDVKTRTVYFMEDVDADSVRRAVKNLRLLDASRGPIKFIVTSDGGEVNPGFALYECLGGLQNDVIAEVYGMAMSMTAAIIQGATKRRMGEYSRFMIHHGSVDLGRMHTVEAISMGRELANDNRLYAEILAKRSGYSVRTIMRMCDRETYLSPKACLSMGFIDEIILTKR